MTCVADRGRRWGAIAALAGLAASAGLFARPQVRDPGGAPQTGTSVIAGVVLAPGAPAQPIRRATISVSGGGLRSARQTITDDSGRFVVADLPAGVFSVTASKPSFLSIGYGARRPGDPLTPLTLAAGARVEIRMTLQHGGVITGTIADRFGRPKANVDVEALLYRVQNGRRRVQQSSGRSTDDRGIYRLYGLAPGDYLIAVESQEQDEVREVTPEELTWALQNPHPGAPGATPPPPAGPVMGFAPTFFPGVTDIAAATTVSLAMGEERSGIDVQLQAVPTVRIEGALLGPDGQPLRNQPVTMNLLDENALMGPALPLNPPSRYARMDPQGQFAFVGVAPGHYTMVALAHVRAQPGFPAGLPPPPPPPPAPSRAGVAGAPLPPTLPPQAVLWAMATADVSGHDLSGLSLTLQPGLTVSGRVTFEHAGADVPDAQRVRIALSPIESTPFSTYGTGSAGADGTFTVSGLVPGRYRASASVLPPAAAGGATGGGPWTAKSAIADGRDILDAPLELGTTPLEGVHVTLTDRVSELSGTLLDTSGAPVKDVSVFVFPTDRSFWIPESRRIRIVRPAGDTGSFRLSPWPPGEYYLLVVTDDQIDVSDRAAMEQLAAAATVRVTLGEGERKVQDLRIGR